jgi:NAD(P)-dependent dehydrogenase (short-subunit alcohol dehydrogenase family)
MTSLFSMEGCVAFVTGGNSGLGRAIAIGFRDAGARVAVAGRRADRNAGVEGPVVAIPLTPVELSSAQADADPQGMKRVLACGRTLTASVDIWRRTASTGQISRHEFAEHRVIRPRATLSSEQPSIWHLAHQASSPAPVLSSTSAERSAHSWCTRALCLVGSGACKHPLYATGRLSAPEHAF